MVLKVPLYLSIEGLDYDDLELESFKALQETISERFYESILLLTDQYEMIGLDPKHFLVRNITEELRKLIERSLENSETSSKRKILAIPRLLGREEAFDHLRKELS